MTTTDPAPLTALTPSAPPVTAARVTPVVAAAAGALLLGLVLAWVGTRLGPVAVVGLVVVALVVVVGLPVAARRPELVVVALAVALPFGPLSLGPLEVVQVAVVLVALGVLVPAAMRLQLRLPAWPVAVPLAGFLVVAAIATRAAPVADLAFRLDVQLVSSVLLVVAMVTALTTWRRVHLATQAFLVAGGAASAWALLSSGPTTSYYSGGIVSGRAQGVFSQPNELGVFAAALLVLAAGAYVAAPSRAARVVSGGSGALLLAALATSLSRGAWIGAVAGLVALAVLSAPARRPLARLVGGTVVGGLVVCLAVPSVGTELVSRVASLGEATTNPYDQRPLIYGEALRQIGAHPVLGHGPGAFTAEAAETLRVGVVLDAEHAHNLFLNVAVEFGLVGLLLLVALMVGLLVVGLGARTGWTASGAGRAAGLPAAYLAALVAVTVHGLFDYPLRNATCITTVWVLVGLVAASRGVAARARRAPGTMDPSSAVPLSQKDVT